MNAHNMRAHKSITTIRAYLVALDNITLTWNISTWHGIIEVHRRTYGMIYHQQTIILWKLEEWII